VNVAEPTFTAEGVYYSHLQQRSSASRWPRNSQSPRPAERLYAAAVFRGNSYVVTEYVAICGVGNLNCSSISRNTERTMIESGIFCSAMQALMLVCHGQRRTCSATNTQPLISSLGQHDESMLNTTFELKLLDSMHQPSPACLPPQAYLVLLASSKIRKPPPYNQCPEPLQHHQIELCFHLSSCLLPSH
jgi:hypothetical protein